VVICTYTPTTEDDMTRTVTIDQDRAGDLGGRDFEIVED
jgi:hypothetical protein